MNENEAVVPRSTVEAALYQATKHTWSVPDADVEAIVAGEAAGPLHRTAAGIDMAFPNPDALRGLL